MRVTSSDWKTGLVSYEVSEWRKVKKAYTKARRGW
jgi:hypothetical protein